MWMHKGNQNNCLKYFLALIIFISKHQVIVSAFRSLGNYINSTSHQRETFQSEKGRMAAIVLAHLCLMTLVLMHTNARPDRLGEF